MFVEISFHKILSYFLFESNVGNGRLCIIKIKFTSQKEVAKGGFSYASVNDAINFSKWLINVEKNIAIL